MSLDMDEQNINRVVTDREADESVNSLKGGTVVPVTQFFHLGFNTCKTATGKDGNCRRKTSAELRLLKAIVENPLRPSSEYARLAGISPNSFQKLRPKLIDKGFIRQRKLDSSGRGRSTILLEPLELGKKAVIENTSYEGRR